MEYGKKRGKKRGKKLVNKLSCRFVRHTRIISKVEKTTAKNGSRVPTHYVHRTFETALKANNTSTDSKSCNLDDWDTWMFSANNPDSDSD